LLSGRIEGREWTSRDGKYTVEAELLSVNNGKAVLKRDDGSTVEVDLDRLSLSDLKYVQEAMDALKALPGAVPRPEAGGRPPTNGEPADLMTLPTPSVEEEEETEEPDPIPEPGSPPLAMSNTSEWQVVPDPSAGGYELGPESKLTASVAVESRLPFVAFSATPSPFVVLGQDAQSGRRQIWDLRTGEVAGEIECAVGETDVWSLSPDGRHVAVSSREIHHRIDIWSFATSQIVQRIKLTEKYPTVGYLGFAGPKRIVVGEVSTNCYRVYDVASGEQICQIHAKPDSNAASCVTSPGGNYVAIYSYPTGLAVYDTRNGHRAGRLPLQEQGTGNPEAMAFSQDGKELAGWFRSGSKAIFKIWDMSAGKCTVTHPFAEDPTRSLRGSLFRGMQLDRLADGSGWLVAGAFVVDPDSGRVVWQDPDAANGRHRLPRKILDADRIVGFRLEGKLTTLCFIPLPKNALAASREAIAAGGDFADAGLPPITRIDVQDAKELTFADAVCKYLPNPIALPPEAATRTRVSLGPGEFDVGRLFFSGPDAAVFALGQSMNASTASWKSSAPLPHICQPYDLRTGQVASRFEIPFPTEMIDLSPNGKFGLFRIDNRQDRLDIWDLSNGQHIAGFRPFEGELSRDRKVTCARFAGDDHVIAGTESERLGCYRIPEGRLVYSAPSGTGRIVGLTHDRRTLIVMSRRTPRLIDASSGETIGTLEEVATERVLVPRQAAVSANGERLAEAYFYLGGHLLVVWDLVQGKKLLQLELPDDATGLAWCGTDHILLKPAVDAGRSCPMISVLTGLVEWRYHIQDGKIVWASPDERVWYCSRKDPKAPLELAAVTLPEPEVGDLLSQMEMPVPLVGPGTDVSVQTLFEKPPQILPEGWSDLTALDDTIQDYFARELQKQKINVVARSPVRLLVGIKNERQDSSVRVRGPLGRSGTLLVASSRLVPYVTVLDPRGNPVWQQQGELAAPDATDTERPPGMDAATHMKLKYWEAAVKWLRTVQIPCPIYDPSLQRGLGESTVGPDGTKILRSPSPSLRKPPDRIAQSSSAAAWPGG
jgi:WD40 repeat protein